MQVHQAVVECHNPADALEKAMRFIQERTNYGEVVGYGFHARVYDGGDVVYKHTDGDDGYVNYAKCIAEFGSMKWTPVIHEIVHFKSMEPDAMKWQHMYVIVLEKLQDWIKPRDMYLSLRNCRLRKWHAKMSSLLYEHSDRRNYSQRRQDFFAMLDIGKDCFGVPAGWDFHARNFMVRGSQPIVTDPLI